jgi:hypothetical protein
MEHTILSAGRSPAQFPSPSCIDGESSAASTEMPLGKQTTFLSLKASPQLAEQSPHVPEDQ